MARVLRSVDNALAVLGKALAQLEKATGASAYKAEVADAKALGTLTARLAE